MELSEILDRLEELLNRERARLKEVKDEAVENSGDFLKEVVILVFQFLIVVAKAPFRFAAGYIKKELFSAVKKDSKLMAVIGAMLLVLLVFFVVFWLSLSVAVGSYFYEKGNTLFVSALYSLVFQLVSSLIILMIAYFSFRKLKSFRIFRSIISPN